MIFTLFVYGSLFTAGTFYGIWVGKKSGAALEKERCYALCAALIDEGKLSPSSRRIMHSIGRWHTVLISEDEFFGKQ